MNRHTLIATALAAAGLCTVSAAHAQSNVTLFGIVDLAARSVKNDSTQNQLASAGAQTSRLGVRGTEDLGGGLRAGFWLEGELQPDTGNAAGFNWQRRATVSLQNDLGEVRLGRDKVPTIYNWEDFEPFRDAGVARSTRLAQASGIVPAGGAYSTLSRASNAISYLLPGNLGGVFGQVTVAAGEGVLGNKYQGFRLGYGNGPLQAAVSYGVTQASASVDAKTWSAGGTYDLKVVKLWGFYSSLEAGNNGQTNYSLGLTVPVGGFELRAVYQAMEGKKNIANQEAKLIGVGAVYNLSRRTALYGTYSQISNTNTAFTVATGSALALGKDSSGYEFGVRHAF